MALPYIGSRISLTSVTDVRYEGVLYTVDPQNATVALQNVLCFGTEGRSAAVIPPSPEVYGFIIFKSTDIKDLVVLADPETTKAMEEPLPMAQSAAQPPTQPAVAPVKKTSPKKAGKKRPEAATVGSGDYDFESANARFAKGAGGDASMGDDEAQKELDAAFFPEIETKYNKAASFFDDITTDRSARQQSRFDYKRQAKIDADTFGESSKEASSFYRRGRRGGRRGGHRGDRRDQPT